MLNHVVRCLLCLCLCATGIGSAWGEETTLNFKNNDEFKQWGTSYSAHTLSFDEGTVDFASANRQTGKNAAITDMPVTKGEPVSFVINDGWSLTGVKLTCKQWTTKKQTITLHYSTDGGSTYTATEQTSFQFALEYASLPAGTNAVKFTFGNANQIGVESLTITYSDDVVPIPEHRVTFSVNGETYSSQFKEGASISLAAPDAAVIPQGLTFMGWTTEAMAETQMSSPALVESAVMDKEDVTFYAVLATATVAEGVNWHKVSVDEIVSITKPDTFAIVNTNGNAFNGVIKKNKKESTVGDGQMTEATFSFDDQGNAVDAPVGTCLLIFSPKEGTQGIEIKRASDNKILYTQSRTSGNLSWGQEFKGYWMKDESGLLVFKSEEYGYVTYLREYTNYNNINLLRTYSSTSGKDIEFVRKGQSITYTNYCTTVNRTEVTISECGYTTVCLPYNAVVDKEATLYSLRGVDNKGLHFVPADTLVARQGYVLQGTPHATYVLTEVVEPCLDADNLLCGVVETTFCQDLDLQGQGDYAYPWILAKDGQFKRYVGASIPAGKAYLDGALLENLLHESHSAPLRVFFNASDDLQPTGIDACNDDKTLTSPCYYNLQGQRIGQPTAKGWLIERQGRKLLLRP